MDSVRDDFFGNCVLWKDGEEECYRRQIEGVNYVPKKKREKKARKERKKMSVSRKSWMD